MDENRLQPTQSMEPPSGEGLGFYIDDGTNKVETKVYVYTNYRLEHTFVGTLQDICDELWDWEDPVPKNDIEYSLIQIEITSDPNDPVYCHKNLLFWDLFDVEIKPRNYDN